MKTRLYVVALMIAVIGLSGCPTKPPKSDNNNVKELTVNGVKYDPSNSDFVKIYQKTGADTWKDMPSGSSVPAIITLSDKTAKLDPANVTLDFSKLVLGSVTTVGSFKVIAENGDTKTYTVKVTKNNNDY